MPVYLASSTQRRVWSQAQRAPGAATYHMPYVLRLRGRVDAVALGAAFREILRRHEVLRSNIIAPAGVPLQLVRHVPDTVLDMHELSGVAANEREDRVRRHIEANTRAPFDIAADPLLRADLLTLDEDEHLLCLTVHHIVFDGWSAQVLFGELAALYRTYVMGQDSPLVEPPLQFGDFATWQDQVRLTENLRRQHDYWVDRLSSFGEPVGPPTDWARPAQLTRSGGVIEFDIPDYLVDRVGELCSREGVTTFMVGLAVVQVILLDATGRTDMCVGVPVAGRRFAALEPMVGPFVSTLVCRGDLSGSPSFREHLQRTRSVMLEAYENQDALYEDVLRALPVERASGMPLFRVMFAVHNTPRPDVDLPDIEVTAEIADTGAARSDLYVNLIETDHTSAGRTRRGLRGYAEYNETLFERGTIDKLVARFLSLLDQMTTDPDRSIDVLDQSADPVGDR